MEGKRGREEAENDRMSNLPDFVLLHMMRFMTTKQAVQTCVLSTRWKYLWRQLTNLTLNYFDFTNGSNYSEFVFSFLSHRDDSISMLDIILNNTCNIALDPKIVDRVMTYVVAHNVQKFTLDFNLKAKHDYTLNPCIFSCHSLTHLNLSFWSVHDRSIQLPYSLQLPALKSLHLGYVTFAANDKGLVDPFRNCHMLRTLFLNCCAVCRNTKILCISNSKLSNLRMNMFQDLNYKIVLSTPNLNSLTLIWCALLPEVSACDLSFLEEVNINAFYFQSSAERIYSALIIWLQVLADYVKILTLSSDTLKVLLLRTSDIIISQLPCFVKLKSLKLKVNPSRISDGEVRRLVNCFNTKSPFAEVFIN